jgi:hypothetical protein
VPANHKIGLPVLQLRPATSAPSNQMERRMSKMVLGKLCHDLSCVAPGGRLTGATADASRHDNAGLLAAAAALWLAPAQAATLTAGTIVQLYPSAAANDAPVCDGPVRFRVSPWTVFWRETGSNWQPPPDWVFAL